MLLSSNKEVFNFRQYRDLEKGEFFVVFGDTAQGGIDKNFGQFMSKTKQDIPLVFSRRGVAAEATPYIHQALEYIFDQTGVQPVFAYERAAGGASEMYRLDQMNRLNKYILYYPYNDDGTRQKKLGWDTTADSRSRMIGAWKVAIEQHAIKIYDEETIEQHSTFVTNRNGKPEADANTNDDGVMSCAGAYQLYLTENPAKPPDTNTDLTTGNINSLIY